MAKGELNQYLGIIGGLHDVFNSMARECPVPEAKPLFAEMGRRFDRLATGALKGDYGFAAGVETPLQAALDHVFEPMARMHELSGRLPGLKAVWLDALNVFDSFEEPVVTALATCHEVAPDAKFTLMPPIKFRYRQPVPA